MATTQVKLPELGENLDGGEVLDVRVAEGDTVSAGQTLLEIEAEKSTVEVPAPVAGRLEKFLVKKGDYIKVDQPVCTIEVNGAADVATRAEAARAKFETPRSEPDAGLPTRGEADEPTDGVAGAGGLAAAGSAKPRQGAETSEARRGVEDSTPATRSADDGADGKAVAAGPATRRLARELGVDIGEVPGTALGGRVTPDDVKAFVRRLAAAPAAEGRAPAPPLPDFAKWGPVERRRLDPLRRRTADQMSLAWRMGPHVTQNDIADVTDLDAFRRQQTGTSPKLTVTAFALKAAAIALKEFERFNASLDAATGELVLKRYYHVGVAVDTGRGLLVPVIRDVDKKSVHDLARELAETAERARHKKVTADEMRGGTFTVTNLGGIGGTGFSPIVHYPEVAILGLSRARFQPAVRDGQVVPRLLLPLSLSYDHRVIDGADAARFTRRIVEMLENPLVMLLHA
jgi:pyruvate dehydrogenase E2 component (dihydrolipoamide acetyltransferase)